MDQLNPAQARISASHSDAGEALTCLDPAYITLMRARWIIAGSIALAACAGLGVVLDMPGMALGALGALAAAVGLAVIWRYSARRYRASGYRLGDHALRVVRGRMFRIDTIVPLGRVQHIDIARGPLERYLGLATLIVHTAGTHNHSVRLRGLSEEKALALREVISHHIERQRRLVL